MRMEPVCFFNNANAEKVDCWWFVYTESHGVFVYGVDDVEIFKYKRIDDEEVVDVEEDLRRKIDKLEDDIYWMEADKRYGGD